LNAPLFNALIAERKTVTEIKFKSRKNMIILPVSVEGSDEMDFVLDTGAGRTVFDAKYFSNIRKKAGFDRSGRAKVLGGGGTASAGASTVKKLEVRGSEGEGVASASDFPVIVMDLSHLAKAIGVRLGGIIGSNFLRDFKVTIDYRRRIVDFDPYPVKKTRKKPRKK